MVRRLLPVASAAVRTVNVGRVDWVGRVSVVDRQDPAHVGPGAWAHLRIPWHRSPTLGELAGPGYVVRTLGAKPGARWARRMGRLGAPGLRPHTSR